VYSSQIARELEHELPPGVTADQVLTRVTEFLVQPFRNIDSAREATGHND
jgi:hypothetical protein